MAPYLPSQAYLPEAASIATAYEPLNTAGPVKRSGCDGFTGSCVIYGQGGDVITTVTVYAPGQVTTVQGVPQTIQQFTTQTVHSTATQTVSGETQTTTVIQGTSTRKQTYCVVTVAGSEIRDLECHSDPSAPKNPYPHPTDYNNDEWDPGWVIGLGVGLALLLIGLLFFIYSRRKKSYRGPSRTRAPPMVTHARPMAAVSSEPVMAGAAHAPTVAASHHPEPTALAAAHVAPAARPHPVPGSHYSGPHPPMLPSSRRHPAEVRVDRNGIRVKGYPNGAVVIKNNRYYGCQNGGHQAANGRAQDPTPPVFPSLPPSPNSRSLQGRFNDLPQPHDRASPERHDLDRRFDALRGRQAANGHVAPASTAPANGNARGFTPQPQNVDHLTQSHAQSDADVHNSNGLFDRHFPDHRQMTTPELNGVYQKPLAQPGTQAGATNDATASAQHQYNRDGIATHDFAVPERAAAPHPPKDYLRPLPKR